MRDRALGRGELNETDREGSDGRQGVNLDDEGSIEERRECHSGE